MTEEYQLNQDLNSAIKYWWLIALFMLLGVTAGWLFSRTNPPWYEARAEIAINFDLHRTGVLTAENQDILVNTAGELISAIPIMDALYHEAQALGFDEDFARFERIAVAERKGESLALRVQSPDPQFSYHLVERWSNYALLALENAEMHAIEADLLHRYLDGLAGCIQQVSAIGAGNPNCRIENLESLQTEITQTQAALLSARNDARGFTPGIRYTLVQPATILPGVVQYQKNTLLLGGTLIGFIAALVIIHLKVPEQILRGRKRG